MRSLELIRRVSLMTCLGGLAWGPACTQESPPLREWTPEDHAQPAKADGARVAPQQREDGSPAPAAGGEARAAAALWGLSCAQCHGAEGQGDGSGLPSGVSVPNFTDELWQSDRSDAQLVQVITEGRGMMPAFGDQLTPAGIQALVRHIRRMQETSGP